MKQARYTADEILAKMKAGIPLRWLTRDISQMLDVMGERDLWLGREPLDTDTEFTVLDLADAKKIYCTEKGGTGTYTLTKVRMPITGMDARGIAALKGVTFVPGTGPKRFARNMQSATDLTEGQREYLWKMVKRFRRQIRDQDLVRYAVSQIGASA